MYEILIDTIIDNLKIFPFLLITYLFLEYTEHKTEDKLTEIIRKAGKFGPILGGLCGAVPQCGFSVAASNFYAARIIGTGTLLAVYLSTSDEMLPILLANSVSPLIMAKILACKILCATIFGYAIYAIWYKYHRRLPINIEQLCQNENCYCEDKILWPALRHSCKITLFIFVITLSLNTIIAYCDTNLLGQYLQVPLWGKMFSALLGLVPNCSPSVILTELYLDGYINAGSLIGGTLSNAGVGLLVLFRVNKHIKENLWIVSLIYGCGVLGGFLCELINF